MASGKQQVATGVASGKQQVATGMASGKQQVATGVESLEKEINSFSKGHINPKVKRFLQSLKAAIIQDNLQEINTNATALKDVLQKENIRLSDDGNKWLNQVQNRVHTQSKQPSSEMIVHGKEVGNRGQGYGPEGPRSAEKSGASGEGPRSRPQSNEDKAQRTQGTGNGKLAISVQSVTEQPKDVIGRAQSTHEQSGDDAGQNRIKDRRKNMASFNSGDKSESGGKAEQKTSENEIDDKTQSGAKPDQKIYSTSVYVNKQDSQGPDNFVKSMSAAVNLPESGSDSENLETKMAAMQDLLDKREKELEEKALTIRDREETLNRLQGKSDDDRNEINRLKAELKKEKFEGETMQSKLEHEMADKTETITLLKKDVEELASSQNQLYSKLHEQKKKNKQMTEDFESQIRNLTDTIDKLTAENKDLGRRYSEVASKKLKDNNPDIVDLSDPNRAMKLGERYGQLYNDAWTDAYEAQQSLEVSDREGIKNLLDVLKSSYDFCEQLAREQLDELSNLLLYPCQDPNQQVSQVKAGMGKPHVPSSNKKALIEIRRQVVTVEGVKQAFLSHMHKEMKTEKERSVMEASKAYYVKCVEICWLMVLHDPPLHMVMDVKPDTKVDPNLYSVLSKGDKVDYLVWPPLLNGRGGGLLQKGVVEVIKAGKKKVSKPK